MIVEVEVVDLLLLKSLKKDFIKSSASLRFFGALSIFPQETRSW